MIMEPERDSEQSKFNQKQGPANYGKQEASLNLIRRTPGPQETLTNQKITHLKINYLKTETHTGGNARHVNTPWALSGYVRIYQALRPPWLSGQRDQFSKELVQKLVHKSRNPCSNFRMCISQFIVQLGFHVGCVSFLVCITFSSIGFELIFFELGRKIGLMFTFFFLD